MTKSPAQDMPTRDFLPFSVSSRIPYYRQIYYYYTTYLNTYCLSLLADEQTYLASAARKSLFSSVHHEHECKLSSICNQRVQVTGANLVSAGTAGEDIVPEPAHRATDYNLPTSCSQCFCIRLLVQPSS